MKHIQLLVVTASTWLFTSHQGLGAINILVAQVGSNVVVTGSGTADLTGAGTVSPAGSDPYVYPSAGQIFVGPTGFQFGDRFSVAGPTAFGSTGLTVADLGSGDFFGPKGDTFELYLPQNYVSGSSLNGSSTYLNTTIEALGLDTGDYVWTWGSGPSADSLTLTVVPEPSRLLLALLALAATAGARRRS